jgi:hypothetical protein
VASSLAELSLLQSLQHANKLRSAKRTQFGGNVELVGTWTGAK